VTKTLFSSTTSPLLKSLAWKQQHVCLQSYSWYRIRLRQWAVDCLSERRQRDKKADKKADIPFISGSTQQTDFRPNGGKQAIYQPKPSALNRARVASTDDAGRDSPLDRSGFADLGIGLVRQASCERLEGGEEGDMRGRGAPRQDSVPYRLKCKFMNVVFIIVAVLSYSLHVQ